MNVGPVYGNTGIAIAGEAASGDASGAINSGSTIQGNNLKGAATNAKGGPTTAGAGGTGGAGSNTPLGTVKSDGGKGAQVSAASRTRSPSSFPCALWMGVVVRPRCLECGKS
ncbi:hypothetical protein K461DRAFT_143322 [Myriangium duriaei CBS 260.36]|uniref:Uncharacterized protein n=1 Tax=Myriangium duriaei CBS 260.36 TaxID=1168546 RepID=A0A9P4J4G4_9PEZI|nr:hypothetical protein K461DRAFT_143322 [Myriangium duriaei CBS 260.36]